MNGITINDKQYKFIATSEDIDCDKCDLNETGDICKCSVICRSFYELLNGRRGCGIFKKLKTEK